MSPVRRLGTMGAEAAGWSARARPPRRPRVTAGAVRPAAVAGLMWIANPRYMKFFLEDGTGPWLALSAVVMQAIGYFIISRMVRIEA